MKHERLWFWLAWRLPRPLVYFAGIRLVSEVSTKPPFDHTAVSDIRAMDAIGQWDKRLA